MQLVYVLQLEAQRRFPLGRPLPQQQNSAFGHGEGLTGNALVQAITPL